MRWVDPGGHYIHRGDDYFGYESVCGSDGKAACHGGNDYVDANGKRYVRVWITNPDGTRSEKIVEEGSPELAQFNTMLSDYLAHKIQLEQAVAALEVALGGVAAACLTPAATTPACPIALAIAIAADANVIIAQKYVDTDVDGLRRNFQGMHNVALPRTPQAKKARTQGHQ